MKKYQTKFWAMQQRGFLHIRDWGTWGTKKEFVAHLKKTQDISTKELKRRGFLCVKVTASWEVK